MPGAHSAVLTNAARSSKRATTGNGGWGTAPKFPSPSHPSFLLRYGERSSDQEAVNMVLHTCERMAAGGIYDQLGGGFSRYSVDAKWLVPHFEKMLYDNAQLWTSISMPISSAAKRIRGRGARHHPLRAARHDAS